MIPMPTQVKATLLVYAGDWFSSSRHTDGTVFAYRMEQIPGGKTHRIYAAQLPDGSVEEWPEEKVTFAK